MTYLEPDLQSVPLKGRRIAVRMAGDGDRLPLVLLHGIGSNSIAWAGQFAGFAADRRVIAWNAPGYLGSTPLSVSVPVPGDYAAALIALLDKLHIDKAMLVGQSLGAIMATATALVQPDRFAALVLVSPAGGYAVPPGGKIPASVADRIGELERSGPRGLAHRRAHRLLTERASAEARILVQRAMSEVSVEGYRQASMMLAHADLAAMAAKLTVPTLVVWGEEDIVTPPDGCARIAAGIPHARSVAVPALGHAMATENPFVFNKIVAAFLTDIETSSEA